LNPAHIHSLHDFRAAARRRLPRVAFGYLEGGAEDHLTLRANREALELIRFVPRALVDVSRRSQRVSVFGRSFDCPFGIAPIGAAGLYCRGAEIALARAARAANVPFVLSTHSFVPLDRVARASRGAPWFQLYIHPEHAGTESAVRSAADAGCEVLVVTTDASVGGNREYNHHNGFTMPVRLTRHTIIDGLRHPAWLADVYLRSLFGRRLPEWGTRHDRPSWDEFSRLRRIWPGKLVVKGVLTVEDARLAERHGADGVWISNHGGRQLDGAPASVAVLPQIAAAVGPGLTVMVDSGFQRGADIVKALALGADMVFVGRAALYGAAAAGEAGASRALQILRSEIDRVLALLGCTSIAELGPQYLHLSPTG
jgi:isopentenyl diphosphate isomerase/L-lactate dehydrogenase-like FMN-dependent dehydrogenase